MPPVLPQLDLATAAVTLVNRMHRTRRWMWSTHIKALSNIHAAPYHQPLYTKCEARRRRDGVTAKDGGSERGLPLREGDAGTSAAAHRQQRLPPRPTTPLAEPDRISVPGCDVGLRRVSGRYRAAESPRRLFQPARGRGSTDSSGESISASRERSAFSGAAHVGIPPPPCRRVRSAAAGRGTRAEPAPVLAVRPAEAHGAGVAGAVLPQDGTPLGTQRRDTSPDRPRGDGRGGDLADRSHETRNPPAVLGLWPPSYGGGRNCAGQRRPCPPRTESVGARYPPPCAVRGSTPTQRRSSACDATAV
jgi:hypothetical protein